MHKALLTINLLTHLGLIVRCQYTITFLCTVHIFVFILQTCICETCYTCTYIFFCKLLTYTFVNYTHQLSIYMQFTQYKLWICKLLSYAYLFFQQFATKEIDILMLIVQIHSANIQNNAMLLNSDSTAVRQVHSRRSGNMNKSVFLNKLLR